VQHCLSLSLLYEVQYVQDRGDGFLGTRTQQGLVGRRAKTDLCTGTRATPRRPSMLSRRAPKAWRPTRLLEPAPTTDGTCCARYKDQDQDPVEMGAIGRVMASASCLLVMRRA
jgi:hypothetical protein